LSGRPRRLHSQSGHRCGGMPGAAGLDLAGDKERIRSALDKTQWAAEKP
jgi:hypothetical protein